MIILKLFQLNPIVKKIKLVVQDWNPLFSLVKNEMKIKLNIDFFFLSSETSKIHEHFETSKNPCWKCNYCSLEIPIFRSGYDHSGIKIVNFGGVFGIWAELTGFSLLGILNACLIVLKLLVGRLNHWKTDCLSNSN